MTQNDKNILLKELCMRLPYGLRIRVDEKVETLEGVNVPDLVANYGGWCSSDIEEVKPYLLPLTSMSEAQKSELRSLGWNIDGLFEISNEGRLHEYVMHMDCYALIEWLIANHFDYRFLIPKGIALDATGLGIY